MESESFTRNQQLVNTIRNMCSCVLQYEALRVPTSDVMMNDTQFMQVGNVSLNALSLDLFVLSFLVEQLQLVNNYKDACNMVMSLATANFTPEEENLVQLLPPNTPIDNVWISEADSLISGTSVMK